MSIYPALRVATALIALLTATLLIIIGAQSAILDAVDRGTAPSAAQLQLPPFDQLGRAVGRLAFTVSTHVLPQSPTANSGSTPQLFG
jgi:hypothetical protein